MAEAGHNQYQEPLYQLYPQKIGEIKNEEPCIRIPKRGAQPSSTDSLRGALSSSSAPTEAIHLNTGMCSSVVRCLQAVAETSKELEDRCVCLIIIQSKHQQRKQLQQTLRTYVAPPST
ncbi:unnamed protein product [Lepeophtheirus salmonis]|uniref:(salmon louse) hypothetical protein n=1 Tax=Lepeophtheirus salmonis TaxID=72036 RepID=A0A7R8CWY2_LEPSM|nr:unnamed protein product [Lepeophtheirus salmonis]CAF2908094.1 unnamed protein product [Lepeophtheirus salmonis]